MNKFMVNFLYNVRQQTTKSLWYLSIYILSMTLVFVILLKTAVISHSEGSFIYRIWGSTIFIFAVFIKFKEDFEFMLTLGSTRFEIFLGKMATALSFSLVFGLFILIERMIVDGINHKYSYVNIVDPIHFWAPYATNNLFVSFFYFFMLCLSLSVVGIFLGTLFYRFGSKFVLAFWLLFSAVPSVFLPFIMWMQYRQGVLGTNTAAFFKYLTTFNVAQASFVILLISVVIAGLTWLNMRKLSQN